MKRPLKGGRYTRDAKTGRLTKVKTKAEASPPPPVDTQEAANQSDETTTEAGKGKSK